MKIDIENIRRWAEAIRAMTDDEDTFLDTLDGQTDAVDVLVYMIEARAFAQMKEQASKDMAATFTERARRLSAKQAAITAAMGEILDAMGSEKVALPIATVTRTKARAKVSIVDEAEIPTQLMRVKASPDLTAIKAQLEAGETVPGATMSLGDRGVSVRIK